MPEFKDIQAELTQAKKNKAKKGRDLFLAKEKLDKLNREKVNLNRGQSSIYDNIDLTEERFNGAIKDESNFLQDAIGLELDWLEQFKPFTDPREHIGNLPDDTPALLFPIRLETRFKKITLEGRIRHQLWVRIFPDECSIDTFEDIPSEGEIKKLQDYWSIIWSAGKSNDSDLEDFITKQKKAAWKLLAGTLQAGRAYWLTQNYEPVNLADLPIRDGQSDIILSISTQEIPPESEAIKNYWKAFLEAKDDIGLQEAALTEFNNAIGDEEKAAALRLQFVPNNLPDTNRGEGTIQISFIQFLEDSTLDTKLSAWSQPATIRTFPERFVLVGFKGENNNQPIQVLNEIGAIIPDPLIVGPNPSIDANLVLKEVLVEEFKSLSVEKQLEKLNELYDNSLDKIRLENTRQEFLASFEGLSDEELTIPLEIAFDHLKEEVKAAKYIDYLCQQSATKWLFDFEEAVKIGMGFKIDLTPEVYENGFDRLFALGLKLSADAEEGKTCLENLIKNHHYGTSGFSIINQGTPTNNTETNDSGYSEEEDFEITYERYLGAENREDPDDEFTKKDGKWLSEFLGIDALQATLKKVENYYHTDQCEARAMNVALWNTTLGYFMEDMMSPVFTNSQRQLVKHFFTNQISGRGGIPSIRIGDQPYGILPISSLKENNWILERERNLLFNSTYGNSISDLQGFYSILEKIRKDFEQSLGQVAYVGKEGDAHKILLQVLGLHASSVEFDQRYAKSFNQLYNTLVASGAFGDTNFLSRLSNLFRSAFFPTTNTVSENLGATNTASFDRFLNEIYKLAGLNFLSGFGFEPQKGEEVPILAKFFLGEENRVNRELIDDQPLSEDKKIRAYTTPLEGATIGDDYITWLAKNAKEDFDKIKKQEGFIDNKKPTALLYQMLRHSLTLGYADTGFQLYQKAGILNASQIQQAKKEVDFIAIQEEAPTYTSKWDYLDHVDGRIANVSVAKHISSLVQELAANESIQLKKIIEALEHLKDIPTARLERIFVEHLDCCSYRLDAWLMGFMRLQLQLMRPQTDVTGAEQPFKKQGTYLGAYGWLENLKPKPDPGTEESSLKPAILSEELQAIFQDKSSAEIFTDDNNAGYIHAPSINQALTAAVLRNAHMSRAEKEDDDTYKVNLSSERVRMALSMIEGMQQGQKLGALLGYQLERGLHDRTDLELDTYIYELRKIFPLGSNRNTQTDVGDENDALNEDEAITKLEARNVIDGLALINHIQEADNPETYPFGIDIGSGPKKLKNATLNQRNAINQEVNRLLNINDAIADLALAESVHQVVQTNYDRAAGTLDTYSKGSFPQTPEVIRTPRSGVTLTHRFSIHLNPDAIVLANSNSRATIEPSINEFIAQMLPSMENVQCKVSFTIPTYTDDIPIPTTFFVRMSDLSLNPIDLLYLLDVESEKNLTALDDYILKWVYTNRTPRPDANIFIHYTDINVENGKCALFQILPLIRNLRALILAARPLKSVDIQLPNEAQKDNSLIGTIQKVKVENAFNIFNSIINTDFTPKLFDEVSDPAGFGQYFIEDRFDKDNQVIDATFLNAFDGFIVTYVNTLDNLNQFGLPQTGFGFVYDRKREIYSSVYSKVKNHQKRWNEKLVNFDQLMTDAQDATLSEEEKIEILRKAERTIATSYTINLDPVTPVDSYRDDLINNKRLAFSNKLQEIDNWLAGSFLDYEDLFVTLNNLKIGGQPLSEFDLLAIETAEEEWQIVVLAEDIVSHILKFNLIIDNKHQKVQELLTLYDNIPDAKQNLRLSTLTSATQHLFGEEFKIIPKFDLSPSQKIEMQKCHDDQEQLLSYQVDIQKVDFPVDDWLYGMARVREKFGHWENLVVLAEGIKGTTLDLSALQFPYQEADFWLALEYPSDFEIDKDKLLYTAYFQSFDVNNKQCGLLLDELTEVVPTQTETTGLSFQYDQPNAEPPQAMLLAMPSNFTGAWDWSDLVDSLHEALDLAKLRAIEPEHIENTIYAQFLPATVSTVTRYPFVTMDLNYATINNLTSLENEN